VIWVRGACEANHHGDDVVLTIRDNGAGLPVADAAQLRLGVGLGATKERLNRMYDRHSLELRPLPEGGTEVRIVLPAHYSTCTADASKAVPEQVAVGTPVHHG
jgi:signal transduction histidine kinase